MTPGAASKKTFMFLFLHRFPRKTRTLFFSARNPKYRSCCRGSKFRDTLFSSGKEDDDISEYKRVPPSLIQEANYSQCLSNVSTHSRDYQTKLIIPSLNLKVPPVAKISVMFCKDTPCPSFYEYPSPHVDADYTVPS